jgi:hypothetical protein
VTMDEARSVTATFSAPPSAAGTAPAPTPKPHKCRRGFKKKKVHGKARCVRAKRHHRHHRKHGASHRRG